MCIRDRFADYSLATQPILSGGATRYHGEGRRNVSDVYKRQLFEISSPFTNFSDVIDFTAFKVTSLSYFPYGS